MTFPLMPMIIPSSRPGENWEEIGDVAYGSLRSVAAGTTGEFMVGAADWKVLYSSEYGSNIAVKSVSVGATTTYGVAYGSGAFFVCDEISSSGFRTTDDGDTWATTLNGVLDNHAVTYNDGYFIVGSGEGGGDGFSFFSTDGITWLKTPDTGKNSCQCGIYVSYLNRTFAAGNASQAKYRSNVPPYATNGDTWTGACSGLSGLIYNVAWSETLGVAVCVGSDGIFYSYSMIGWTRVPVYTNVRAVAWCYDRFVAVGGIGAVYVSDDGVNWTGNTQTAANLYGVAYSGGVILATGDNGTILRSS